jgi:hypothetical protein
MEENYRAERIEIAFGPRDQQFAVPDAAVERDPKNIPDIGEL